MARTGRIPKRRGYVHYALSEIEAHHLAYLRDFLTFIYREFEGVADCWAVLSRLLFNLSLQEVQEARPGEERKLVGLFSLDELRGAQKQCAGKFHAIMDQVARNEPIALNGVLGPLRVSRLGSGEEVLWGGVGLPKINTLQDVVEELEVLLRWSLMYLRREAILRCHECGRYFLRRDARKVEYCSSRCRYLIANRRRKRKSQRDARQKRERTRRR